MIQEITTTMQADAVLAAARRFFQTRTPQYGAFVEREGPDYLTFRGQGGEEIVIGVMTADGGTRVRGSTYFYDGAISRFFASLDPTPMAEESVG